MNAVHDLAEDIRRKNRALTGAGSIEIVLPHPAGGDQTFVVTLTPKMVEAMALRPDDSAAVLRSKALAEALKAALDDVFREVGDVELYDDAGSADEAERHADANYSDEPAALVGVAGGADPGHGPAADGHEADRLAVDRCR